MVWVGGQKSHGHLGQLDGCQRSIRPGNCYEFVVQLELPRGLPDFTVGPGWALWCGYVSQGGGLAAANAGYGVATGSRTCGSG